MNKYIIYALFLGIGLMPKTIMSQQELGTHFLRDVIQSNFTNPAIMQSKSITIALPSPHLHISNSGFSLGDLIVDSEDSDSTELNVDGIIDLLKDKNDFHGRFQLDLFAFGYRRNNLQFTISARSQLLSYLRYPKNLVEVGWNGNANFTGDTIRFSPKFSSTAYQELAIGAAYEVNEKLQLGAKLKYLIGIADISTGRDFAAFYTDETYYQTTFITDVLINTSMVDIGDPEDIEFDYEFKPFTSNSGVVFDLGFLYRFNEQLEISGSILNLGSAIRWREKVSNFTSFGNYTFEGVDVTDLLTGGSIDTDSIVDEISENFEFRESDFSYRTRVPTQVYISSIFRPINSVQLGGLFHYEWYEGAIFPALTLSASKELGNVFSGGLTYSVRRGSAVNVGTNFVLRGGPVLFFFNSDNILGFITPRSTKGLSLRFGLNIGI